MVSTASEPSGPEAETESVLSAKPKSEVGSGVEVDVESQADVPPAAVIKPSAHIQAGFVSLDVVNVREVIAIRGCVMKVPPAFLRAAHRSAMR